MSDQPTILAFMITRADTPERVEMFKRTVQDAFDTAKYPFKLHLHTLTKEVHDVAIGLEGDIDYTYWEQNVGQHVITNEMIDEADEEGYDLLLRLDDDVQFLTKGWLKKMVEAANILGPNFIISPLVRGLNNPPPQTEPVEVQGIRVRFLTDAIGGICRLHHIETLCDPEYPYRADVRMPLGFGDATGLGRWCNEAITKKMHRWMVYLEHVRVKHAKGTKGQNESDPQYHYLHDVFQTMPYVPAWEGE